MPPARLPSAQCVFPAAFWDDFQRCSAQQCQNCGAETGLLPSLSPCPLRFPCCFCRFSKMQRYSGAERMLRRKAPASRPLLPGALSLLPFCRFSKTLPLLRILPRPSLGAPLKVSAGSNPQGHKGLKTPPASRLIRAARHSFRFAFSSPSARALFPRCGRSGFPVLAKFSKKP